MSARLPFFFSLHLIVLLSCVFPAAGISVSCSSGGGGETVSSSDNFDLDDSTSLQESISLDFGIISKSRDASGSGNNSLDEYISGTDYSLQNSVQSTGSFGLSSSASATAQSGSLAQDVAGMGSMSISLSSAQGSEQANQEASVTYGALDSVQAIAAGEGVYAAQSTGMAGLEGSILSGAVGSENAMGATGTFTGAGLLEANLAASTSAETGRASASGTADLDGATLIDSSSFDAVSSQSLGMGLEGLRDVGDGYIGSFDVNVLNLEQDTADDLTSQSAALQTAGGSASSYKLTGYKWHQSNPQIQLYLNTNNAPSGITAANSQAAITAAANTWDDAVAQNIFADSTTVILDNTKVVDNPLSSSPVSDGYNVHGWANLGNNYLGMCRWWSNGVVKDGYKSILEADIWYASDKAWTTDLSKATGSTFDLQSVAVHELGHTIGMGDIYPTSSDFAQVMNSYDGAQRVLGNGDLAGAQTLYGSPWPKLKSGKTTSGATSWKSYGDALYVDVDTSSAGFADTPLYFASLGGSGCQWENDGFNAIYSPTATGFRIYLRGDTGRVLTPEFANQMGWYVQWAGAPKSGSGAGSTTSGATSWKSYGDALYVDVDTSSAGFTDTPLYFTSLGGSGCQWENDGFNAIYSPTATGFRIYLRGDTGRALTPEFANQMGWNVQWFGVPRSETGAGSTTVGSTNWNAYSSAIYADIDTSKAGFSSTPIYLTSLAGNYCQWEDNGFDAIYFPTATSLRIYLRGDTGRVLTPEFANQMGWNIQWLGI